MGIHAQVGIVQVPGILGKDKPYRLETVNRYRQRLFQIRRVNRRDKR